MRNQRERFRGVAQRVHRRKAVLLVSQGLPASVEDIVTNQHAAGAAQALRDFIVTAQRSNIAVYPMDPCGLELDEGCNTASRENLQSLAENTGGFAVTNTNAPERSVDRMVAENGTYYLLGYASPAPNDGRRHRIRVRTRVPDVEVRARDGYYAPRSARVVGPPPSADSLIDAPIQTRGLTMRVAAVPAPLAQKPGATVAVGIEMPSADTVRAGSINFSLVAVDSSGKIRSRQRFTSTFTRNATGPAGWVHFGSRVDVPAGSYQVRLAAVAADGEIGSVFTEVIVPDFGERLALGGLSLASASASSARLAELLANVMPLVPLARREVSSAAQIVAQLPIRVSDAAAPLNITATVQRGKDAARPLDAPAAEAKDYAAPGGRIFSIPIPTGLEPGSYRLVVQASTGRARASREIGFTVR
jgi:hypothetical protein